MKWLASRGGKCLLCLWKLMECLVSSLSFTCFVFFLLCVYGVEENAAHSGLWFFSVDERCCGEEEQQQ